jgi:hypothetical protein
MNKEITISLPEDLFNKLEEESKNNNISFDGLILKKLNLLYK